MLKIKKRLIRQEAKLHKLKTSLIAKSEEAQKKLAEAKDRKEMILKGNENVELSEKPNIPKPNRIRQPAEPNNPYVPPIRTGAK